MQDANPYQIIVVDDASLSAGNRAWNSQENRNLLALVTICRTRRWCIILTAPLKSMIDNQIRALTDLTLTVYKPFHAGGFNILKAVSTEISTANKEYKKRLHFADRRIDFWACLKPSPDLTRAYDIERNRIAVEINTRIVETGNFKPAKDKPRPAAEVKFENLIEAMGPAVKRFAADNPDASLAGMGARFGLTPPRVKQILAFYGLPTRDKKPRVVGKGG